MLKKLLLPAIFSTLAAVAAAQTPTLPIQPDEAVEKFDKERLEFLRETAGEVGRLRTVENRISFNSEIASLMWFHDEKEARAMYADVVAEFKQLLSQYDAQMNSGQLSDEENSAGGLFGNYGKSKAERRFRNAMNVRRTIALSLAEHAPDLAYSFFYDSLDLISSPQLKKETEQSDKYFEYQLMKRIAQADAAKAADFGKESLKRGLNTEHIELLKKIYEKDAKKGIEFGAALLSRLKTDRSKVEGLYFYNSLLSFGVKNFDESKKPGAQKPVYESSDLRDIADLFAQAMLDLSENEEYMYSESYVDTIEKYSPGKGTQIRAKFHKGVGKPVPPMRIAGMAANTAVSMVAGPGSANSNTSAQAEKVAREEREKAEKKMAEDVKGLASKPLAKEERDKVIAQARKIISQMSGKDKKIMSISFLAAQVAHLGDKDLANEIMLDAERLVNTQPKNYQDYLLCWMLVSGYAEVNPDKAFPLLESTILRANDTLAAFIKVAEFIDVNDEIVDDGEMQIGLFGDSMVREIPGVASMASGTIRTLARADLRKVRNMTDTFDRAEIRILAKMLVLRAISDKGDKKPGTTPADLVTEGDTEPATETDPTAR